MSAIRSGGAVSSSAVSAARSTSPASTVSISGIGRRRLLLVGRADAGDLRQDDVAGAGAELALDQAEEGGLAGAVAADEPDLGADRQRGGGRIEEAAPVGVENEVLDAEHGRSVGLEGGTGSSGSGRAGAQAPGGGGAVGRPGSSLDFVSPRRSAKRFVPSSWPAALAAAGAGRYMRALPEPPEPRTETSRRCPNARFRSSSPTPRAAT